MKVCVLLTRMFKAVTLPSNALNFATNQCIISLRCFGIELMNSSTKVFKGTFHANYRKNFLVITSQLLKAMLS